MEQPKLAEDFQDINHDLETETGEFQDRTDIESEPKREETEYHC